MGIKMKCFSLFFVGTFFSLTCIMSCGGSGSSSGGNETPPPQQKLPEIIATDPVNGTNEIGVKPSISVIFNKYMDCATITPLSFFLDGGVTGTILCDPDQKVVTLTPDIDLSYSTLYVVTLTNVVKDRSGNSINAYSWEFETGVRGQIENPRVTIENPIDGEAGVVRNVTISVIFSVEMDSTTIIDKTFYLKKGVDIIPSVLAYSFDDNIKKGRATLTPNNILDDNAEYTVTITTGVKNLDFSGIADPITWSFTTLVLEPPDSPQ